MLGTAKRKAGFASCRRLGGFVRRLRMTTLTYEDRIRQDRSNMSKSFARLADFLLDSYVEAAFMTASELAHALNLDAATVVRFSQHLGYSGYPKLQREIRDRVKSDLLIRPQQAEVPDSVTGLVSDAMNEVALAL